MKESEYLILLEKQLSGEICQEELTTLEQWLSASDQNRKLADGFRQIWEKTTSYGKTFHPDLERDFAKVQARIQSVRPMPMRANWSRPLLRVAAGLAILVAAFWSWQNLSGPEVQEVMAVSTQKMLDLPDGTHVWLQKGSSLVYANGFSGNTREVTLKGEGFFQVKHDPEHPFQVKLETGGFVEVLGTEFDIKQEAGHTVVIVQSGKVRFSPQADIEGPQLAANQKADFDYSAGKITISRTDNLNELAWQKGGLTFISTPLKQVVKDLELYYGVSVQLQNPEMMECPHSAPLTNQPIEKVLESISLTHQLRVEKTDKGGYILSGGACN